MAKTIAIGFARRPRRSNGSVQSCARFIRNCTAERLLESDRYGRQLPLRASRNRARRREKWMSHKGVKQSLPPAISASTSPIPSEIWEEVRRELAQKEWLESYQRWYEATPDENEAYLPDHRRGMITFRNEPRTRFCGF